MLIDPQFYLHALLLMRLTVLIFFYLQIKIYFIYLSLQQVSKLTCKIIVIVKLPNIALRLPTSLSLSYSKVQFVNLSMSAIGAMGSSGNSLLSLLNDLHFDKTIQKRIIMKTMSISLRSSYCIFCRRNKPWTKPELLLFNFSIPSICLMLYKPFLVYIFYYICSLQVSGI